MISANDESVDSPVALEWVLLAAEYAKEHEPSLDVASADSARRCLLLVSLLNSYIAGDESSNVY
jgi:hypothetical protein